MFLGKISIFLGYSM